LKASTAEELARIVGEAAGRSGAARTLLLDIDGTLAPIAPTPEAAAIPERTLRAVRDLVRGGWAVAAVSGRPSEQIRRMLPVEGVMAFGSHGLEGTRVAGLAGLGLEPGVERRLRSLGPAADRLAQEFVGVRVEHKAAGIAFHDRALQPSSVARWRRERDAWLARQDLDGLETIEGKCVLEIRPAGIHKGRVVEALARRLGLVEQDPSFVAVGDDVTDEDMFRAMRGLGLAVRVGPDARPTAAVTRVASTDEVSRFLALLADVGG
jgi:trehalose-phosphatase